MIHHVTSGWHVEMEANPLLPHFTSPVHIAVKNTCPWKGTQSFLLTCLMDAHIKFFCLGFFFWYMFRCFFSNLSY